MTSPASSFRLYSILAGLFSGLLVISTVAASKIVSVGGLHIPGGTLVFPLTFIFNDILTETYGYVLSRRIIWTGFLSQVLAAATFWAVGVLPAAPFWHNQDAYNAVLGLIPRIVLASFIAYLCGEFANSVVLSKMKYWHQGRRGLQQGWRFVASTIVGEGIDSALFMTIAFAGTMPPQALLSTMGTLYVLKVVYEILALPLSTRIANYVKRVEHVDHIDRPEATDYNPFSLFRRPSN